ncbi:hypothetical protein B0H15DRAFT_488568 [Mycena belliarum]|uniref:Uncharacterized protein n=1 Tax=Mycena belliarum TaxID=1033014 RepID=A0AAD6TUW8_9AGAR|nr:hypothetical protein B0H15DRAFT_488568 [Mycena belliae]
MLASFALLLAAPAGKPERLLRMHHSVCSQCSQLPHSRTCASSPGKHPAHARRRQGPTAPPSPAQSAYALSIIPSRSSNSITSQGATTLTSALCSQSALGDFTACYKCLADAGIAPTDMDTAMNGTLPPPASFARTDGSWCTAYFSACSTAGFPVGGGTSGSSSASGSESISASGGESSSIGGVSSSGSSLSTTASVPSSANPTASTPAVTRTTAGSGSSATGTTGGSIRLEVVPAALVAVLLLAVFGNF